jgi:hypothetical protein
MTRPWSVSRVPVLPAFHTCLKQSPPTVDDCKGMTAPCQFARLSSAPGKSRERSLHGRRKN